MNNEFDGKKMGQIIMQLRHEETQQTVADAIGVRRETIKQWENEERQIKAADLFKIAKYFGVSADYLLGLSDVASPDPNIQAVCQYTGLTEDALDSVQHLCTYNALQRFRVGEIVNSMLSCTEKLMDVAFYIDAIDKENERMKNPEVLPFEEKYFQDCLDKMQPGQETLRGEELIDLQMFRIAKTAQEIATLVLQGLQAAQDGRKEP